MKTKVQSIHFDADQKLVDFIESKLEKLDRYYDRIILTEVILRLDKSHDLENKVAEVKMKIPGKELFAKRKCITFEEAADTAVEAIRNQILKHKGKQRN